MDGFDAGMPHLGEGGLHRLALRIKNGFFRRDDDFCFHACAGKACKKSAPQASYFYGVEMARVGGNSPIVWRWPWKGAGN
jgi:hypothetical protein